MRSYVSKQKQWREWCLTPRPGPDGVLSAWPDGELVTPDKLAAWLSEDLLLRRVAIPGRRLAK
jgi:Centromere DNA-binding protein complex CBF3 subunit, domain 2